MKILIFDIIHGGDIIAERLVAQGFDVVCVDVYKYAKNEIKDRVRRMGASLFDEAPAGHYDLLLAPSHCPVGMFIPDGVTYDRRKTFHQVVHDLINDGRFRIEVTGVKGKTSLCYLLAHILDHSGKKVFLHTSRGQGPYIDGVHHISAFRSIAPTSLLTLPEGDFDVMVTEVSLGGSGKADIAVITNILEDYGIAKNTDRASNSKASIFTDKINIVSKEEDSFWLKFCQNLIPYGNSACVCEKPSLGVPIKMKIDYNGEHEIEFGKNFLGMEYLHAVDAALTICRSMNIGTDDVISGLESFPCIPGRGELRQEDGRWIITERNPGISHISVESTLSTLGKMGALDGLFVILNPVNKRVCDKLDLPQIIDVINRYGVKMALYESGIEPQIPAGTKTVLYLIKEGYQ